MKRLHGTSTQMPNAPAPMWLLTVRVYCRLPCLDVHDCACEDMTFGDLHCVNARQVPAAAYWYFEQAEFVSRRAILPTAGERRWRRVLQWAGGEQTRVAHQSRWERL